MEHRVLMVDLRGRGLREDVVNEVGVDIELRHGRV